MVGWILFLCLGVIGSVGVGFYLHQVRLKERAHLMREAIRNQEYTFRLPVKGLLFGERALQEALNETGMEIAKLVAQNEVESWQKLTRVLTHEIMNVTTPIVSISQAYLDNPKIQGTPYEEGIRAIHDTSVSLALFVDNYRKLTQLQEPIPTDVSLLSCILGVKTLYPKLDWRITLDSSITLRVDEHMLRQVLINLVKNAIEAGATLVDIRWNEGLLISNNGQLIPPQVAAEIFIPFYTTKKSGSGIGLSLSRQLLVKQGRNLQLLDKPVSGYPVTFQII